MTTSVESDFHDYHLRELPLRLASHHGAKAAVLARELPPLCCRIEHSDNAYTYRPEAGSIAIVAGTEASAVIELSLEKWQLLVNNSDAMANLLIASELDISHEPLLTSRWKAVLCAMFYL